MTATAPGRLLMPEDLRRPFRYATRRNPDLRTQGGKIGALASAFGKPLYPHQQYIADVSTELNPPGSHLTYRYQLVIIAEPRQVGKTTLMRPVMAHRCIVRPRTPVFMTAQLGKDARERWAGVVTELEHSAGLAPFLRKIEGKGSERLWFPNNSFISPFAPGPEALHGETPPLVSIDEGWAFSAEEGANLRRAIRPAQITLRDRQLWIMSAAGNADSEWWNELVEIGRASVNDPGSRIAYFEHSMDPEADPYDETSWDFHPGLDGLITLEDLREEAKPENNKHVDWLRGYMNIATTTRDTTVLDLEAWDAAGTSEPLTPPEDGPVYGYDVAIDRTAASVWRAWRNEAGQLVLAVQETREDTDWLPDYLANLYADGEPTIGADDGGPVRVVTDRLRRHQIPITTLDGKSFTTSWAAIKAALAHGELIHDGSPAMRAALEVAAERTIGDVTALSRRHSLGPIDPPVAATVAAWLADRTMPDQMF